MVNHGLTTGAIFFLVGVIWERRGTLRITDLGGLQKPTPMLAAIFLAVVMSAVGPAGTQRLRRRVPGARRHLHHPSVVGGRRPPPPSSAGPSTCCGPTSGCSTGPSGSRPTPRCGTSPGGRSGAVAPLLAGIVFLGVYPRPFLDRVTPSVNHLLAHVQARRPQRPRAAVWAGPAVSYSVPADQNVDGKGGAGASPAGRAGSGSAAAGRAGSGRAGPARPAVAGSGGAAAGSTGSAAWVARVARAEQQPGPSLGWRRWRGWLGRGSSRVHRFGSRWRGRLGRGSGRVHRIWGAVGRAARGRRLRDRPCRRRPPVQGAP